MTATDVRGPDCCWRCNTLTYPMTQDFSVQMLHTSRMILCSDCGNKRCPKASDHRLGCTSSNEPDQPGSVY